MDPKIKNIIPFIITQKKKKTNKPSKYLDVNLTQPV